MNPIQNKFLIILILTSGAPLYFPSDIGSAASSSAEIQSIGNMDVLIERSDTIVLATVERISQGLKITRIHMAVQRVFKGDPTIRHIELEHNGGKHIADFTEPTFTSYDKAILFLTRNGNVYRCTGGSGGKKTIVNDNVYLEPNNSFATLPLKKYTSALESGIRNNAPQDSIKLKSQTH